MTGTNEVLGGGGFHHVALRVKDFDASVKFYTEVLGFTRAVCWSESDNPGIMLDTGDGNYLEIFAGGDGSKPEGAVLHFALRTTRLDEAVERARAAGAEVTMEPQDVDIRSEPPLSVRVAFFRGPDGEAIELFQQR